jgi:hypothetical protein
VGRKCVAIGGRQARGRRDGRTWAGDPADYTWVVAGGTPKPAVRRQRRMQFSRETQRAGMSTNGNVEIIVPETTLGPSVECRAGKCPAQECIGSAVVGPVIIGPEERRTLIENDVGQRHRSGANRHLRKGRRHRDINANHLTIRSRLLNELACHKTIRRKLIAVVCSQ